MPVAASKRHRAMRPLDDGCRLLRAGGALTETPGSNRPALLPEDLGGPLLPNLYDPVSKVHGPDSTRCVDSCNPRVHGESRDWERAVDYRLRMDEEELKQEIGRRIVRARDHRGMSQKELAEATGWIGVTRLSNYENGIRLPDRYAVNALAGVLSCPAIWLGAYDLMMPPDERALWYKYWSTDKRGRDTIQSNAGNQPATDAGPWTTLLDDTG